MVASLRWRMRVVLLVLSCSSLLAGCDMAKTMAESSKHEAPIAQEIENAVGKRPTVISVTTAGFLVVTVQFKEVPALPVPAIEAVAREAVVHEFKAEPEMLSITFLFEKRPA